jgi:hypothetical protein
MISSRTPMARYIKKFTHVGHSLGPSEERSFALWVGYDIDGVSGDLAHLGLINVDGRSDEELRERGVTSFLHVGSDDEELLRKLGLDRRGR